MNNEIKNTSPIFKGTLKLSRRFLGEFLPKTNFDRAHLRAYLKGATQFRHGYTGTVKREPAYHEVKQEYFYK